MKLYEGTSKLFVEDTTYNRIADKLSEAFSEYYGRRVSPAELASWTNSLQHVKNLVVEFELTDNMVVLEYELPYCSQRIDCTVFGAGADDSPNVLVLELKQWSQAYESEVQGNVTTFLGGAERMVAHPSAQARGYQEYLQDFVVAFREEPQLGLSSAVYCHNYQRADGVGLHSPAYADLLAACPVFGKQDFDAVGSYLSDRVGNGEGEDVYRLFANSQIMPSKQLLDLVASMIQGQRAFTLLDEQIAANNAIVSCIRKATASSRKTVILVRGGPGTGKSVIALNAVGELAKHGKHVVHATGSKSFTTAVRKIAGSRGSKLFQYFNSFLPARVAENSIDGLICDEAHRLRESSNSRFTRREHKSDMQQIDELIRAARVSAFFIDDAQVVRGGEIGNSQLIREHAAEYDAQIYEFELTSQFRCGGSDDYLEWIDRMLGLDDSSPLVPFRNSERMRFEIVSSAVELRDIIETKNREKQNSARLVAGFCWPWSDPNEDGTLPSDVVIGDFAMPWEARDKGRLAPGIPKWFEWASKPGGVNQVGCIYTAQGFEFDYIGVIVGPDLTYDPDSETWGGHPEASCDPYLSRSGGDFTQYVKNIYRVLLTRGMKGCFVYFIDRDTEEYLKEHLV